MKLTLPAVTNSFPSTETNSNFDAIEQELQNKILYRDNPTGEPNQMENTLDMNSNRILNLPVPVNLNEAARLKDVQNAISGATANLILYEADYAGSIERTIQDKLQEQLSVKDFGAVGDGVTNDEPSISAAVLAAAGKTLYFPKVTASYKLNSNIVKPATGINVIIDPSVSFSGTGRMFAIDGNAAHDYTGTTFSQVRSGVGVAGRGYSGLSSEFIATAGFLGNGCGAFFSTKTPDSAVGFYWALNPILELNPGLTGNGIACEVDLNNYTANGKGQGVLVTGVGNYSSQVGVAIERADLTSDWQFGSIIKNSQVGLRIDGTSVVAPVGGLQVIGYANNLVKMVPLNDTTPGDAAAYLSNAAETVVNWKLTKRGGMQIGIGGAEIQKYLSASGALTFGSIAANTTSELTVTVTGAAAGDLCIASPDIALVAGFTWSAYCTTADTVRIRLANCTIGALDPDSGGTSTWRVSVIKH